MKTFNLALMALAFSFNFAFANNVEPGVTTVQGKVVTLDLTEYSSDFIEIAIIDIYGYEIYSEKVNTVKYKKRSLSLTQLPLGQYSIKLKTAQRVIRKNLELEKNQILLHEEVVSFKPNMFVKENKWNLDFLVQKKEARVSIFDNDETLYSETFKDELRIYKSYDLDKLKNGKYYLRVETDDNTYTKSFVKS